MFHFLPGQTLLGCLLLFLSLSPLHHHATQLLEDTTSHANASTAKYRRIRGRTLSLVTDGFVACEEVERRVGGGDVFKFEVISALRLGI